MPSLNEKLGLNLTQSEFNKAQQSYLYNSSKFLQLQEYDSNPEDNLTFISKTVFQNQLPFPLKKLKDLKKKVDDCISQITPLIIGQCKILDMLKEIREKTEQQIKQTELLNTLSSLEKEGRDNDDCILFDNSDSQQEIDLKLLNEIAKTTGEVRLEDIRTNHGVNNDGKSYISKIFIKWDLIQKIKKKYQIENEINKEEHNVKEAHPKETVSTTASNADEVKLEEEIGPQVSKSEKEMDALAVTSTTTDQSNTDEIKADVVSSSTTNNQDANEKQKENGESKGDNLAAHDPESSFSLLPPQFRGSAATTSVPTKRTTAQVSEYQTSFSPLQQSLTTETVDNPDMENDDFMKSKINELLKRSEYDSKTGNLTFSESRIMEDYKFECSDYKTALEKFFTDSSKSYYRYEKRSETITIFKKGIDKLKEEGYSVEDNDNKADDSLQTDRDFESNQTGSSSRTPLLDVNRNDSVTLASSQYMIRKNFLLSRVKKRAYRHPGRTVALISLPFFLSGAFLLFAEGNYSEKMFQGSNYRHLNSMQYSGIALLSAGAFLLIIAAGATLWRHTHPTSYKKIIKKAVNRYIKDVGNTGDDDNIQQGNAKDRQDLVNGLTLCFSKNKLVQGKKYHKIIDAHPEDSNLRKFFNSAVYEFLKQTEPKLSKLREAQRRKKGSGIRDYLFENWDKKDQKSITDLNDCFRALNNHVNNNNLNISQTTLNVLE